MDITENDYCEYGIIKGNPYCKFGIALCPVCGDQVFITGYTKDKRIIGSCGDAFTVGQWEED